MGTSVAQVDWVAWVIKFWRESINLRRRSKIWRGCKVCPRSKFGVDLKFGVGLKFHVGPKFGMIPIFGVSLKFYVCHKLNARS